MSRPLRLHIPGMLYHVVARGDDKQCIFTDDRDCESFLESLQDTLARFCVSCIAYCLLWNHYHLLLAPREISISRMMQQLNSAYCQRFNRRHGRVGHVLQGRFAARLVEDGAYARSALRYIALNPVASGRTNDPSDWRWSSYRATAGLDDAPDFLQLGHVWAAFGTSDAAVGRARFLTFVRGGLQEMFLHPLLHGSDALAQEVSPLLGPLQAVREFSYSERFATRPSIGVLLEGRHDRIDLEDAAYSAFCRHAYTLAEIGLAVRRSPSTIWRWVQRAGARRRDALGRTSDVDQVATMSGREDTRGKIKI